MTRRVGLAAVLFLLAAPPAQAQAGDARPPAAAASVPPAARTLLGLQTDRAAALYAEGRAAALALRFDAAEDAYARLATEPGPSGAYALETLALWRALLTERDADATRFGALNDSLESVAEAQPDGPATEWLLATVALHRALAHARAERYPRAGLAFRDACGRFRRLAAVPGALPDARFGQGVCEVAAGSVPRKYRWLTRLVGFSGTVAGGLAHLTAAADGRGVQAEEAVVMLAVVDQMLNEGRAGGEARLEALAAQHPDSPGLAYLEGYRHYVERRAADAERAFRRAEAALARPGTVALPTLDAHLGMTLFRQDRFAEAAPLLERYARNASGQTLLAQTTLHAGLAYEMAGDRRRADGLYRRVRATRDYDTDLAAAREAERRRATPLTPTGRRLILGSTAFDSGRYADVLATLQPVLADAQAGPSDKAEAAYRMGRALQALRRWDEAVAHYRLAAHHPDDPQARWGPWAQLHTAEVQAQQGQRAEARQTLQALLRNEAEFDFSKALEQRARAALDRVERAEG